MAVIGHEIAHIKCHRRYMDFCMAGRTFFASKHREGEANTSAAEIHCGFFEWQVSITVRQNKSCFYLSNSRTPVPIWMLHCKIKGYIITGISPAIVDIFGNRTRKNLKTLRKYKVKDCNSEDFLKVFKQLPMWEPIKDKPTLILYGSRDIPEIISACNKIREKDIPVINIEDALHNDIYLNEATHGKISNQLQYWFK